MAYELDIFGRGTIPSSRRKKKKQLSFEKRFLLWALGASLFPLGLCELFLWIGNYS